jgi:hypothetical protein
MKPLRLALTVLMLVLPVRAQDSGVSLTIRFVDGTSRFHVGEIVPIELSFRALIPNRYDMKMRNYDRSGRLDIEQFHVVPPGRDPLQDYYSIGGYIGGGLGGLRALSGEPEIVREDLNEWVALDQPGHYSLYVTSGRVSRRDADKSEPVELRSNSLEFEVVAADPAWRQQTVSSAVATLSIGPSTDDEKTAAVRTLRFLDTPGSVRELVRLLGSQSINGLWNEVAGLAGSRNQSLVVRELEQHMNAPEIALTADYLHILAKLRFQLDHGPLPAYPEKDVEQQKIWRERSQARDEELTKLEDALYEKTITLVSTKSGKARAETVRTLLLRPSSEPGELSPLTGLPADEVAAAFLNLSSDEQWNLLSIVWERLRVPAMAAPLKKLLEQPDLKHQMLRDAALRCLYELDPSEAAPIFMQEIMHPHLDNGMFTVKGETLGVLPNETLPQFDQMLSDRLEQKESRTTGLDAQLVGRYSTTAILTKVKSAYEASAGQWDCVTEDGFVVYFLRVDPAYGVKRLAVAPSFCMTKSLPTVVKMQRWNAVEPGIIARVNEPDLNRARQAAEVLAKYGSPQAEDALWDRLRRFHAEWAERANELASLPGTPSDAFEAMSFQFGLVEAIGTAQAWLLNNEQITELENLTLGHERDNVKRWHWSSPVDLSISLSGEQVRATINSQYTAADLTSLRSKLAQYPRGTKFWVSASGSRERVARVFTVINDLATEHGFQVDGPQRTQ